MTMHPDLWPRVTVLMDQALHVPARERHAWLAAQAAGDERLISEVTRLLAAHARADDFLEEPLLSPSQAASVVGRALRDSTDAPSLVGETLGHYRLVRDLGRGGMGTVYLGTRDDAMFEKQVAIKVAVGSRLSEEVRERFARERQMVAALEHPGIARLLDGGATDQGLEYLVMEYVDGVPIDVHCATRSLDVPARLGLVLDICRAVQYAHDHQIVHCDIKPSNVLVGHDGRPRLIDFGIAKVLPREGRGGEIGPMAARAWTPESASPEQVRGEPSTGATDVYGLGALLYRLLTDRPVFDLRGRDDAERMRIICEVPPQRPSEAWGANGTGARAMAADLDLIVLKALAKVPADRYGSVAHLADDLERVLTHRPVGAAPNRWPYRTRKFLRRHPVATVAAAVALTTVVLASVAAIVQARKAAEARARADSTIAEVRRIARTLIVDASGQLVNSPNATSMQESLIRQALRGLERVTADSTPDFALGLELADTYGRLARVQGSPGGSNLGDRAGATRSLEKGRALLAPFLARNDPPLDAELKDLHLTRELASTVRPDAQRSRALADEALRRAQALYARAPDNHEVTEALAAGYFYAAMFAGAGQELALWKEASAAYRRVVEWRPEDPDALRNLALTEKYIGAAHVKRRGIQLARTHYERALELDRRVAKLRPDSRQTSIDLAIDLSNVASVLWEDAQPDLARISALWEESLALRERAAAADPRDVFARQVVGFALINLSNLARRMAHHDRAVTYGRRAVDVYESLAPSEFIDRRGAAWLRLGEAVLQAGGRAEGCRAIAKAKELFATPHLTLYSGLRSDLVLALARCGS